jgi:hypothetical protein
MPDKHFAKHTDTGKKKKKKKKKAAKVTAKNKIFTARKAKRGTWSLGV